MHCCCGQCEISISDTYASREAFVKVRQFICVYWQTAWNVLVKNCKSLPFLYATFRPVNTSIWKWESCLCPESAHIALPVPPGGTPVVWPSSQLFMCWGSRAKSLCQVIVLRKSIKKLKVWFSLHDMWFSLSSWNPLQMCFQGWTGLLAYSAVMSPPPLLFTKQDLKWRAIKSGGD